MVQWALAKVIRDARTAIGITQVQLADFSCLSYPYISDLERGNMGVTVAALLQLADALKVNAAELMRRVEAEMRRGPQAPRKVPGRPRKHPLKAACTRAE